jgi:phospholipase/carboxylesterase
MQDDLILQQPPQPQQLVLLFHGVGSKASDLAPLGRTLAPHMPDALIVSVQAPDAQGSGWQWFSVRGVTEANRPARVAETMQRFVQTVRDWQQASGVDSARTILIGFSQGAIMVLESTQQSGPLAGRVFALAGRFAQPPQVAPMSTLVHLLVAETAAAFSYFFRTDKNKGPGVAAKPLTHLPNLVGGAGFEPATPAV